MTDLDRSSQLQHLLDAWANLIATVTEGNEALADKIRADLENDGCLLLAYRPMAGRLEISLGTAERRPVTLFEAFPAKPDGVSIN